MVLLFLILQLPCLIFDFFLLVSVPRLNGEAFPSNFYQNWYIGEPGGNHCAVVNAHTGSQQWTKNSCFDSLGYVCEAPFVAAQPTTDPTTQPSRLPSTQPSIQPSSQPTSKPSRQPSCRPFSQPSAQPSRQPFGRPTTQPSSQPSRIPTLQPTSRPTRQPSVQPSSKPSLQPTIPPTVQPSVQPRAQPSTQPSSQPSRQPVSKPTTVPSSQPSRLPSSQPTSRPTRQPTVQPSRQPSSQPTNHPTSQPSVQPSLLPTRQPSSQPSFRPSNQPSNRPTDSPTDKPTRSPTSQPSSTPSLQPSTIPTCQPSGFPTGSPTGQPTSSPSRVPSGLPTQQPSSQPSSFPTSLPTMIPSSQPSGFPTTQPSSIPSSQPTSLPSSEPTVQPTGIPSGIPSAQPSSEPSTFPSAFPSNQPTNLPTSQPSACPSRNPTCLPSGKPTEQPSSFPSSLPTLFPTTQPSFQPSEQPSSHPTDQPSSFPSISPSNRPSSFPSGIPSSQPSGSPTDVPSRSPSTSPSTFPSTVPTTLPSSQPTSSPSGSPSKQPLSHPTISPTTKPSSQPQASPSRIPTGFPSSMPSLQPYRNPSSRPSDQPTKQPISLPSSSPSRQPQSNPTASPSHRPLIANAVFAADGTSITVEFSWTCLGANLDEAWSCSKFLDFSCANISTCQWMDTKTAKVVVPVSDYCVKPEDKIGILERPENGLCSCFPTNSCNRIDPSLKEAVIQSPKGPLLPTVVFNLPAVLPSCSGLYLGLSSSFGNLRRSWSKINVSVVTKSVGYSITELRKVIQSHFNVKYPRLAPPLQISANYFKANTQLEFTVTLCNFLGGCQTNEFTMNIIDGFIPTATILKSSLSSDVFRYQSLLLLAEIQRTTCNTSLNLKDLQYSWIVSRLSKTVSGGKVVETSIKSISKDTSRLLLSPYALQANQSYEISLTTRYLNDSSSSLVQIQVKSGGLRAVIQGNNQQSMRVGELINLDGSQSYDEDKENVKGEAAGLQFFWSCSGVTDDVCSQIVSTPMLQSGVHSPVLTLKANQAAVNMMISITLTVSDPMSERKATSTVTINILPSLFPTIALSSNSLSLNTITNKVNPGESLRLMANVDIPTPGMIANITWFSADEAQLKDISITSLHQTVSSAFTSKQTVYLALLPNSLTPGRSYSFGFSCQLSGNIKVTSFITVAINAPPTLGSFEVSPSTGSAYIEPFHFTCSNWQDVDLPLSYLFSFLSNTGLTLVTKSLTPLSYTDSVLPEGLRENNHRLTCQADIYDSLNANTSVYYAVQVDPLLKANLSALVHLNIDTKNAVALDDLIKGVNIASSLLNQPNCSNSPNCTELNRFPCLSTSHTCGPCQISYFSSKTGDGNELCVNQLPDQVLSIHHKPKECFLNCSSHGDCIYYSQVTGRRVDACFEGDLTCYSSCSCDVGYKLSQHCEMSDEESKSWISLRDLVVERITANVALQDPSEQAVSSWMNSLLAISQVPNQISEKSLNALLDLSQHALTAVGDNGFSATTALANYLAGVDSLSAVLSILEFQNSEGGRRKLETFDSYTEQISKSLKDYSRLLSQSMVPGQSPTKIMKSYFKLYIQNVPVVFGGRNNRKLSTASACSEQIEITLPQTLLENGLKQAPTRMFIPNCAEGQSSLEMSAFSLSSKLFDSDLFTSNALSLSLSASPCLNSNNCSAEVILESHNSGSGLLFGSENRTVDCFNNDFTNHSITCRNQRNYSVSCRGKEEKIIFQCPAVSLLPSCQGIFGSQQVTNCETKSFGNENITCVCSLAAFPSSGSASTTELSVVALLTNVETTFVSTILSAHNLNANTLTDSWEALVTVGIFLLTTLLLMCFSVFADGQAQKKVSIEEKVLNHAKVHSVYQQKLLIQTRNNENEIPVQEIDLFKMAEETLPGMLSSGPSLSERVWSEEKKFHRWLGIIYYFSTVFPRILRVVSLASNIIIMLFIQSLTYNYTHGDDNSCQKLTTEDSCLQPKSLYGTGDSKCYWKAIITLGDSSSAGKCEFIQPENSIEVMLFVAIFSGLASAPLAIIVDWIINNILSAPSSANSVGDLSKKEGQKKEMSVFPSEVVNEDLAVSSTTIKRNTIGYQIVAEKDYQRLRQELLHYRSSISDDEDEEHRKEIDRLWALSGEYWDDDDKIKHGRKTVNRGPARLSLFVQRLEELINWFFVDTQSISKSLHQELTLLYDSLEKERIKFKVLKTEREQSKRLLYLFQKDLIPAITGEILESKEQRENIVVKPVSVKVKVFAWFFLGILDLGMLFYVFLFAVSQDSHRQAAWGRSLGIYLVLDIVLISTLMVIFLHVLLPSLIMRDVGKIKKKVTESIEKFYDKMEAKREVKEQKKQKESDEDDDSEEDEEDDSFDDLMDSEEDDDDPLHSPKVSNRKRPNQTFVIITEEMQKQKLQKEIGRGISSASLGVQFNAAKYLFLSYRLAEQYPDLKASQMILQYSSPWPKQDYKHIKDVKSNYSDKYSGITRAISIIVIFFLTNLLAAPLAIQDMILQLCTTAAIGYTILVHIQLYYIYPVLVVIPTLAIGMIFYLARYYYWNHEAVDKDDSGSAMRPLAKKGQVIPPSTVVSTVPTSRIRRESLQHGIQLASQLNYRIRKEEDKLQHHNGCNERDEESQQISIDEELDLYVDDYYPNEDNQGLSSEPSSEFMHDFEFSDQENENEDEEVEISDHCEISQYESKKDYDNLPTKIDYCNEILDNEENEAGYPPHSAKEVPYRQNEENLVQHNRASSKYRVTFSEEVLTVRQFNPLDDYRNEKFTNNKVLKEIDEDEDWDIDEVVDDGSA
jgi:hypothetical protein